MQILRFLGQINLKPSHSGDGGPAGPAEVRVCATAHKRTAVAIVLVPVLGYFGAELSNPAAWIAACLFLYPAYRWTCRQLDNRLLTARLHIQGDHAETVL